MHVDEHLDDLELHLAFVQHRRQIGRVGRAHQIGREDLREKERRRTTVDETRVRSRQETYDGQVVGIHQIEIRVFAKANHHHDDAEETSVLATNDARTRSGTVEA